MMRAALLLTLLLAGCGGGRAEAEAAYGRALAALRDGELRAAAAALDEAATAPELAAHVDFLRGNVAFARCEVAAKQAETAGAEPFAFDIALRHADEALRAWERAAMTRSDWPAARRNVERALRKRDELRRKKAEAEDKRRRESDPQPKPKPRPKPPPPRPDTEPESDTPDGPQLDELSPAEVRRLLAKLAEKEREKIALRQAHRRERMAEVERDW